MAGLVTLEGCKDCPDHVPTLSGFSLTPNFGPWAKLSKGKQAQKLGQTAALIGAATGNSALVALGAGKYLQGRGQVKSANRSIRTISDVGKAAAVIGGAIIAAPLAASALGIGSGAAAAGAGAASAGAAAAGASAAGASAAGAGAAAAGASAAGAAASGGGLLASIGSGIVSALPSLAAPLISAGAAMMTQQAAAAGFDAAPIAQSIQSGDYGAIPGQIYDIGMGAAQQAVNDYSQSYFQPSLPSSFEQGGLSFDPYATLVVDPASQAVTLERSADIDVSEPTKSDNTMVLAAAAAIGLYFMTTSKKRGKR